MDIFITIIRWIIIIVVPIYLLNIYIKSTYKFSLNNYLKWLVTPSEYKSFSFPATLFTILLFVAFAFFFSIFVNRLYIKNVGERVDYTYLGNSGAFIAQYIEQNDLNHHLHIVTSPDIEYNDTFNNVGLNQSFLYEPTLTDELGDTLSQFSLGNLLSLLHISFTFFIIMMGPLHMLLQPMAAQYFKGNGNNYFKFDWKDSFNAFLKERHLNLAVWFIMIMLLLFLLVFSGFSPRQQFGERILPLPDGLKKGLILKAVPTEVNVIYKEITIKDEYGDNKTKYVKTKKRNVTFKFDGLFERNVFVSTTFSTEFFPELENKLIKKINTLQSIDVVVTDNLGIDIL